MTESEARRLTKVINETALIRITEAAEYVAGDRLEDKVWVENPATALSAYTEGITAFASEIVEAIEKGV